MVAVAQSIAITGLIVLISAGTALAGAGGPCGTGTVHSLPEPASIALLGAGVAGIFALRRRSRRK